MMTMESSNTKIGYDNGVYVFRTSNLHHNGDEWRLDFERTNKIMRTEGEYKGPHSPFEYHLEEFLLGIQFAKHFHEDECLSKIFIMNGQASK